MSAASPAQTQVRRNAAAAPSRSPQPQPQAPVRQAAPAPQAYDFNTPRGEEEIRVNLSDIPVMRGTLHVEGFEPSVLSRLFGLIAPLNKR